MMELSLNLLIRKPIISRLEGRRVLTLWAECFPGHTPERYGDEEPLRNVFDAENIEEALNCWGASGNFEAARRNPHLLMNVTFAPYRHSSISIIRFQARDALDVAGCERFLYRAAEAFDADYGVVHILTKTELDNLLKMRSAPQTQSTAPFSRLPRQIQEMIRRAETPEAKQGSYEQMLARVQKEGFASVLWEKTVCTNASIRLEKCIPDLYWVSFFGPPYVEMFGREMLLSAPVSRSLQIGNGGVALKLVDTLDDNQLSYEQFRRARNRCKEYLGVDAFCAADRSSYRTPKFHFPEKPAAPALQ